jgi:hypothetical protein
LPSDLGWIASPLCPNLIYDRHRDRRIKFSYDDVEPLSMNVEQASTLAEGLHQMGEEEMASEVEEAVKRARHYETM